MLQLLVYFKKQIVLPNSLTAATPTSTHHYFSAVPCFSPVCFIFACTSGAPKVKENILEEVVTSFFGSFIHTFSPPVAA